jgi:hypothetical protein
LQGLKQLSFSSALQGRIHCDQSSRLQNAESGLPRIFCQLLAGGRLSSANAIELETRPKEIAGSEQKVSVSDDPEYL